MTRQDYESFVKQLGEAGDNPAIWEELHETIKRERQETETSSLPPEVLGTDTGDVEERFLQPPSKAPWLQNHAPTPAPTQSNEDLTNPSGRYVSAKVPQPNPNIPLEAPAAIVEERMYDVADYSREAISNIMEFTALSEYDAGGRVLDYVNIEQTNDVQNFQALQQFASRSGRDILNAAVSDVFLTELDVSDQNNVWGSLVTEYDRLGDQQTLYQIRKSAGDPERMAYAVAATVDFALSQPSRVSPSLLDTFKEYGFIQDKLDRPKQPDKVTRYNPFVVLGNILAGSGDSDGGYAKKILGFDLRKLWTDVNRVERDGTGVALDNSWANFYRLTGNKKDLSQYEFFNGAEINHHANIFAELRNRGTIAAQDLAAKRNDLIRSMESYGTGGQQYFAVTMPVVELVQIKSLPIFRGLSYEDFLQALMLTEGDLSTEYNLVTYRGVVGVGTDTEFKQKPSKLESFALGASGPNYASDKELRAEGLWTHIGLSVSQQEALHRILVHGLTEPRITLLSELEAETERREKTQKILIDWRDAQIAAYTAEGGVWPPIDPTYAVPLVVEGQKVDLEVISNQWLMANGFKSKPENNTAGNITKAIAGEVLSVSAHSLIGFDEMIADDLAINWITQPGYVPEEHFEGVMDDQYKRDTRKKWGMLSSVLNYFGVDMTADDYAAKAEEADRVNNQSLKRFWQFMQRTTQVDQKVTSASSLYLGNWPVMALETGERLWNATTKAHAMSAGSFTD